MESRETKEVDRSEFKKFSSLMEPVVDEWDSEDTFMKEQREKRRHVKANVVDFKRKRILLLLIEDLEKRITAAKNERHKSKLQVQLEKLIV